MKRRKCIKISGLSKNKVFLRTAYQKTGGLHALALRAPVQGAHQRTSGFYAPMHAPLQKSRQKPSVFELPIFVTVLQKTSGFLTEGC